MRITLESRKQRAFDMAQILTDRHADELPTAPRRLQNKVKYHITTVNYNSLNTELS